MRDWALTTIVIPGTLYHEHLFPITDPIFAAYAERWDMTYLPHFITDEERAEFNGTSPAPAGTEANYANIPRWRQLLDEYEGVVLLDVDAVVVDFSEDICAEVNDSQPLGAVGAANFGVVVTKAHPATRQFLDAIWEMREACKRKQWLEQAAAMLLLGFNAEYENLQYLGPTQWTPFWKQMDQRWNSTPFHQSPDPRIMHPAGVQPFEKRLELVRRYAELSADLRTPDRLVPDSNSRGETK